MSDLIYPQLSYQIVGALYEVYNHLYFGHKEKIYQKALAEEFKKRKLPFEKEMYFPIKYDGKLISKYYFDFVIDNKVVVELKVANDFYQKDINQLLAYLKHRGYKLGILAVFTKEGLKFKRIANTR